VTTTKATLVSNPTTPATKNHEIGADVRGLRTDAAAQLPEQGPEAGAETHTGDQERGMRRSGAPTV
jgi:hypothetical protein